MPLRLSNLIYHVLTPVLGKCCVAFFDDVIIYSDNKQKHVEHVKTVLDLLINMTKTEVLGFRVGYPTRESPQSVRAVWP